MTFLEITQQQMWVSWWGEFWGVGCLNDALLTKTMICITFENNFEMNLIEKELLACFW